MSDKGIVEMSGCDEIICRNKHCLKRRWAWISGPMGETSPPRKRGTCGILSLQDKSHASNSDPLEAPEAREDESPMAPQCVGELRTPTIAPCDEGSVVVQPPQPDLAMRGTVPRCSVAKTTIITLLVSLPVQDLICGQCGRPLETVGKAMRHFMKAHSAVSVVFECRKCGRTSDNSHSISCHAPKCKGMEVTRSDKGGRHCCVHCPERFTTAMGLTQHTRHKHVAQYCRNKEGELTAKEKGKEVVGIWNNWEIKEILRLSNAMAGVREINKRIACSLGTGKTADQVREKRRGMRLEERSSDVLKKANDVSVLIELLSKPMIPLTPPKTTRKLLHDKMIGGATKDGIIIGEVTLSLRRVEQDPALLNTSALELQRLLRGGLESRNRLNSIEKPKASLPSERRSSVRAFGYKRKQEMYKNNQPKLAKLILDGNEDCGRITPSPKVAMEFRERWDVTEVYHGLGQFCTERNADNESFRSLISAAEVCDNLGAIKNETAAGPDGVTKAALREWDPTGAKLAETFSIWMSAGTLPRPFKECRTTLIPKTNDPVALAQMAGWRPLTIGSVVLRLYSRILTHRLARACPISPRQRGFISSPGCSENLMILGGLIKRSRMEGETLAVVLVDFARAFDSVSHLHILEVLRQRGLDEHIIGIVGDSYTDVTTTIKVDGEQSPPIDVRVGVKQGDPMSPLLFNLALDPMINTLERYGLGYKMDDRQITTLAFADDLALVSDSWEGMTRNIRILETFCQLTGLKIQPKKCHGFLIQKIQRARVINHCDPWIMCEEELHMVGAEESVKYLGLMVSPWYGIMEPEPVERLRDWISSIGRSSLKPSQKVRMLNVYAIPRMVYQADHGSLRQGILRVLDGMIRKAVKRWLHLPPCTCDGLLYSKCQDGGLGIAKLACQIPSIQARRVYRLWNSEDDITRLVTRRTVGQREYTEMWLRAGGDEASVPPLGGIMEGSGDTTDPTDSVKPKQPVNPNWRQAELLRWQGLTSQGVGIQAFGKDGDSNHWLGKPEVWGFLERHYIASLQLRANVYPTREALSRGRAGLPKDCRRCMSENETCSHILGQCPAVKESRIRRHHKLCELLANEAESAGWKVTREMCCKTRAGAMRRPDLVFVKNGNALVADATVRYEMDYDTLMVAAAEKVARYTPVAPYVMAVLKVKKVQVFGFPLGARGKWPIGNNRLLKALGINGGRIKQLAKLFSRRALLYSLDVLRDFYRVEGEMVNLDDKHE